MIKKKPTKLTNIKTGRIYITATFNNTLVTVTDQNGNTINWGSTGASGFKGSRLVSGKYTNADNAIKKAKEFGLTSVKVFIKGPGPGRDSVLGVLRSSGLKVIQIADITPIPHNGCRPKKRRRG